MENNLKSIYERAVWTVLENIAKELRLAKLHCPYLNEGCTRHLDQAEKIATDYVLKDKSLARKCQRE